jgi:hypothetical protein
VNNFFQSESSFNWINGGTVMLQGDSIYWYYHSITRLNHTDDIDFEIYPNPCADEFTIQLTNPESSNISSINIYDVFGKKVFQQELVSFDFALQTICIKSCNWNKGIYFIEMFFDKRSVVRKIIKQ